MDDLVARAVDEYVASIEEERVPDGKWHPSSISSPCTRAALFNKQGRKPTNPPNEQTKRVFRIGHIFHKFVQDAIANMDGILGVFPEIDVECEEHEIKGTADVLTYLALHNTELVEIKSIKDAGLNFAIPKPEHIIQATVYAHCLVEHGGTTKEGLRIGPLGGNLKHIRFVYVGKETMTIREKVIDYTPELESKMLKRLNLLQIYDAMGELPNKLEKGHWYRNYCQYKGSGMCCADEGIYPEASSGG